MTKRFIEPHQATDYEFFSLVIAEFKKVVAVSYILNMNGV